MEMSFWPRTMKVAARAWAEEATQPPCVKLSLYSIATPSYLSSYPVDFVE